MLGRCMVTAFSWKGAFLLVSAVAFGWFWIRFGVDGLCVMGCDDGCHVVHAAVAHFQGVSITYPMNFMIFWEVFIY